jgi:hypothetical protein
MARRTKQGQPNWLVAACGAGCGEASLRGYCLPSTALGIRAHSGWHPDAQLAGRTREPGTLRRAISLASEISLCAIGRRVRCGARTHAQRSPSGPGISDGSPAIRKTPIPANWLSESLLGSSATALSTYRAPEGQSARSSGKTGIGDLFGKRRNLSRQDTFAGRRPIAHCVAVGRLRCIHRRPRTPWRIPAPHRWAIPRRCAWPDPWGRGRK